MRVYSALASILLFAMASYAQLQDDKTLVSVGKQRVKLPTPSGYINAWEQYPALRSSFEINEADTNQMLAIYAPSSSVTGLNSGTYLGFPRYFKVSVTKKLANVDVTESEYSAYVESFEKGMKKMYDADNPRLRHAAVEIQRDLKKYLGSDLSVELKEPAYLGASNRSSRSFTCAVLMAVVTEGKNVPLYVTTSVVLVKNRILLVYFYGQIEREGDIEAFKAETQTAVQGILDANPVKLIRLRRP